MSDLGGVSQRLGKVYKAWKNSEKMKDEVKKEFFAAVTEELKDSVPAQAVEEIEAASEEEVLRIAQRRFVRHTVISHEQVQPGTWKIVLEEDPTLRPYTYVNKEDGMVYQRIVSEGSPVLDDEAIQDENPELWQRITKEVTSRELIPLEEMSEEDVSLLQPYISMPKPQVRLGAPRAAKSEELDDDS